jgi:hypothetical protein
MRAAAALAALAFLPACHGSLSPLSNRIDVGQEPYLILVADGEGDVGDLFASRPAGGTAYQVTFTRVDERLPALSPDGSLVAFIRTDAPGDTTRRSLVVMNLLNGAERRAELGSRAARGVAWSRDGHRVFVAVVGGVLAAEAPPGRLELAPVSGERPEVDSLFRVLLGDPPQAEAVTCDSGGLCARFPDGSRQLITTTGGSPARWPGDSLAYLVDGEWVIRPLLGGRSRTLQWTRALGHPRSLTVFGGVVRSAP